MHFLTLFSLLPSALGNPKGTFDADVQKSDHTSQKQKRDDNSNTPKGAVIENFNNQRYFYTSDLYVGSDKQKETLHLDTGSHWLWFTDKLGSSCGSQCFDPESSTSFKNISEPWSVSYAEGSDAKGFWSRDTVEINGVTVEDVYFGLAESASRTPIWGLGFVRKNSSDDKHPYFLQSLQEQGLVERQAFAVSLDEAGSKTGQVLFGGVDHSKYNGTLGVMPIAQETPSSWTVMLSGIGLQSGDQSCPYLDFNVQVILDTGTSYASLPKAVVDGIAKSMNYTFGAHPKYYTGDCDLSHTGYDSLELDFSGVKVHVNPETLLDTFTDDDDKDIYKDGKRQCQLAILPTDNDGSSFGLGDVFLRNFYTVFDYDNIEVALADVTPDKSEESDIEVIKSDIPEATRAPRYSSTQIDRSYKTHSNLKCTQSGGASTSTARPTTSS